MRAWALGIVMGTLAAGCALEADRPARVQAPIIDGRVATESELFATVAVFWSIPESDEGSLCTGTLIERDVVVTAGHCVVQLDEMTGEAGLRAAPEDVFVIAGFIDLMDASQSDLRPVERIAVAAGFPRLPPGFDPFEPTGLGRFDDIAILVLAEPIFGQTPMPVLPLERVGELAADMPVIISGYGQTDPAMGSASNGILNIATTPLRGMTEFELAVGGTSSPRVCYGDSGGPTYVELEDGMYLIGATSRGFRGTTACVDQGIQTLVPAYLSWIEEAVPPPPLEVLGGGCSAGRAGRAPLALLALLALVRRR